MNLVKWSPFVDMEGVSSRFKSYLRAISIPRLGRSRDVDYTGLNAALRRYEQDKHNMPNQDWNFRREQR